MRRVSLFLLFLLLGSLLAAAPVRAETVQYYALSFDGEDDYVDIPDLTVSKDAGAIVILFKSDTDDYSSNYDKRALLIGKNKYASSLYIVGDGSGSLGVQGETNTNEEYFVSTSDAISTPLAAHLIVTTFDAGTTKTYLDNNLINTKNIADNITLGLLGGNTDVYFEGKIYLVLIYNRALSDSEIQAIYNDPLHPPTNGLVLWLAPDSVDTANGKWLDKSGNGNDGTIYGATYVPLRPVSESTPSQNTPYGLYFDGEDDYVRVEDPEDALATDEITVAIWVSDYNYVQNHLGLIAKANPTGMANPRSWQLGYYSNYHNNLGFVVVSGGSTYIASFPTDSFSGMLVGVADGTNIKLYANGELKDSVEYPGTIDKFGWPLLLCTQYSQYWVKAKVYSVMIWNRALSDTEIQQIYENPNNPPKDGLVLFYSPYSYDPESGRWLNIAPIFPTIPLAEELDGVNYGAKAVRVSIPSLSVYDAVNGTPISPLNVSLSMLYNNTTTGLVPSLPVLPYNETVTLNVSATGYYPRLLTTWTGINSLAVYLQPITPTPTPIGNASIPVMPVPSGLENYSAEFNLQFGNVTRGFFSTPLGISIALALAVGLAIMSLVYHKNTFTTLTVFGVTVTYLAYYANAPWGIAWTPLVMWVAYGLWRMVGKGDAS